MLLGCNPTCNGGGLFTSPPSPFSSYLIPQTTLSSLKKTSCHFCSWLSPFSSFYLPFSCGPRSFLPPYRTSPSTTLMADSHTFRRVNGQHGRDLVLPVKPNLTLLWRTTVPGTTHPTFLDRVPRRSMPRCHSMVCCSRT